jgi:glycerol-3-phosphate O-acyltransferase
LGETIQVSIWLAVLIGGLATASLVAHFILPGSRWFLRRRVDRVIADINTRLELDLPPFMLTKRYALIDRLVYDPKIQSAARDAAAERGVPQNVVMEDVKEYAREIVPGFNAYFYFRFGNWLASRFLQFFFRLRLAYSDENGLDKVRSGKDALVLVINHRSNFDYMLVSYLASGRAALSYAAGEWALFWPYGALLRAMGAYFVRRRSGDPLYRRVLERYVQLATEGRVPQGVFPEAALSPDGRLQKPHVGILNYMLREFDPEGDFDIVFVPVGLNYERVVEDEALIARRDETMISQRGTLFVLKEIALFGAAIAARVVTGRWRKFGRACANFGTPLSLRGWLADGGYDLKSLDREKYFQCVRSLGDDLMDQIAGVIPVLPASIVAVVFHRAGDAIVSELEIKAQAHSLIGEFENAQASVYVPFGEESVAVADGLRMMLERGIVRQPEPGRYAVNPEAQALLEFYVAPVEHFLSDKPNTTQ